ncbi:hypothetical protein BJ912DRAFT_1059458 [Pholiota molesta]|nr:hypothetical protein BJ912DRAFT_1059458 [Pholiota molesta]
MDFESYGLWSWHHCPTRARPILGTSSLQRVTDASDVTATPLLLDPHGPPAPHYARPQLDVLPARALPVLTTTAHVTAPFSAFPPRPPLRARSRQHRRRELASQTMLLAPLPALSIRPRPAALAPTHIFTHRLAPALPEPPILAVGPAELDFALVQTGLRLWPWRSALMYAALVGAGAVHAAEGVALLRKIYWAPAKRQPNEKAPLLGDRTPPESRWLKPWTKRVVLALALVALPVLAGVYTLAREPTFIFKDLAERYRAAFLQSAVYRAI